jgi:hypothetical protein
VQVRTLVLALRGRMPRSAWSAAGQLAFVSAPV